jgi:two-component system response regulator YesN
MLHKIFLVEDEIVTREGIRDSVDWAGAGYQFCGDAADGEMALPLIHERRPSVVITDIRMPFMDGLQLSSILRETLPEVKIIILTGHSEFKYAQQAIGLGVTEYLLKPVSAKEIVEVLRKVGRQIEQERLSSEHLHTLQLQSAEYSVVLREQLLLNLANGVLSSGEAIARGHSLGMDLLAPWYLLLAVLVAPDAPDAQAGNSTLSNYEAVRRLATAVEQVTGHMGNVLVFKRDALEMIVILKGDEPGSLQHQGRDLEYRLRALLSEAVTGRVIVNVGEPVERLGMVATSYRQLLMLGTLHTGYASDSAARQPGWRTQLARPDTTSITRLLSGGAAADFGESFGRYIAPLGEIDEGSSAVVDYACTNLLLTTAAFVRELGGDTNKLLRELSDLERQLVTAGNLSRARDLVRPVIEKVLAYRDLQTDGHHVLVARARAFIDQHYADAEISLRSVAAQVMLSPSYFSVIFAREVRETFIEYLTRVRIARAKELLRTTSLTASEITYQIGYNNPRYFFAVFRKVVGVAPNEFRRFGCHVDTDVRVASG